MRENKHWLQLFSLVLLNNGCLCRAEIHRTEDGSEHNVFTYLKQDSEEPKEITTILDLLKQGDKNIKLGSHTEAILVLGNSGSGKSTFTQLVAGDNNNLISKEVEEDTGEFIIVDTNDKISDHSTITSKTIFPEMVVDEYSNVAYYDCPGFSDTRSVSYDIAATYFIKKVVDHLNKVKFVFIVNHSSLRQGIDRYDFMTLVKHAVNMVKNVTKFNESIALVASKVENNYIKQGKELVLISDEKIIKAIATFLTIARDELEVKINTPVSNNDRKFYKDAVEFINVLLIKSDNKYARIGVFRRPDVSGVVSKIDLLQKCKKQLKVIIGNNIDFASKEDDDFGYTISADSKNRVGDLVNAISKNVLVSIVDIGNEIRKYYDNKENQLMDLSMLQQAFKSGHQRLSGITTSKFSVPSQFIDKLNKDLDVLDVNIPKTNILRVLNNDQHMQFFQAVTGHEIPDSTYWLQRFFTVVDYLNDSQKWYSFLINLFSMLSELYVQKNAGRYYKSFINLRHQFSLKDDQNMVVDETDLKKLVDRINSKHYDIGYDGIKHLQLNKRRADFLGKIIDMTVLYNVTIVCGPPVLVTGQFVTLNNIYYAIQSCYDNSIRIFALNKIFINGDFNKAGQKLDLVIIAPTWDIVSYSRIVLDGDRGEDYSRKAKDGTWPGGDGVDGIPGVPGGNAGNFFGIGGDFINIKNLSIFANGGDGGAGQHAGNGARGRDGENPPTPRTNQEMIRSGHGFEVKILKRIRTVEFIYEVHYTIFAVYGQTGGKGGNGGNGGVGGLGGFGGSVKMINLKDDSGPAFSNGNGKEGPFGYGGYGGSGGLSGNKMYAEQRRAVSRYHKKITYIVISKESNGKGKDGPVGIFGFNKNGRRTAGKKKSLPKASVIINDYKRYLRENLPGSIVQHSLRQFMSQLDGNGMVRNYYDTLGLVNERQ